MEKLQILFFFISGFLISRLVIKSNVPDVVVKYLICKRQISLTRITLSLISISALLSFFIPNVIAVLTLLPIINLIKKSFSSVESSLKFDSKISTLLALSLIYGANIGGMGSITSTPANGILVSFLELNSVSGSENITFVSWLIWGIPLVLCFILISWFLLTLMFNTYKYSKLTISIKAEEKNTNRYIQKITFYLLIFYFLSSIILSLMLMTFRDQLISVLIISGLVTLLIFVLLFFVPFKLSENSKSGRTLLVIKDLYSELPVKGFIFVGIALIITGILYVLNVNTHYTSFLSENFPAYFSAFILLFIIALITSFSTEILSNTAIQIAMFTIMLTLSEALNIPVLQVFIVITLSSTCAFMSPIATGVNGLAFGGINNVSLRKMLTVGAFMNIIGALLISFWIKYVASYVLTFMNF